MSISWQGCEYETIRGPVDCDEDPVILNLASVGNANCELTDGRIEVSASGGTKNYRFKIGQDEPQESPAFEGLAAGVYQITAFDANNCSANIEATVKNINGLNITFQTTAGGCNASNGTITVTATDGTQPYQFKINDGTFEASNSFTSLPPGNYDLVVTDASGCEVSQPVTIRSGINFASSIKPIFETNCTIDDCHNGSQLPDFRQFKNIFDHRTQIKDLTGDRTMPEDGTLTQTEIDMIACWVDDGAPNN